MTFRARDKRLKDARVHSDRRVRDLKRDQRDLERRENLLMLELRKQIKKGDIPKAKIVARQLAHFKEVSDRNYSRSIFLQSEAQIRKSNNKINQAHIEFLKGMQQVNDYGTIPQMMAKKARALQKQDEQEAIENLMNEGFEQVFEHIEDERPVPAYFDEELAFILREAVDPKLRDRRVDIDTDDVFKKYLNSHLQLTLRVMNDDTPRLCEEATVSVQTLEISVDMLKRIIYRDDALSRILNLPSMNNITLGIIENEDGIERFVPFSPIESLAKNGITEKSTISILIHNRKTNSMSKNDEKSE